MFLRIFLTCLVVCDALCSIHNTAYTAEIAMETASKTFPKLRQKDKVNTLVEVLACQIEYDNKETMEAVKTTGASCLTNSQVLCFM